VFGTANDSTQKGERCIGRRADHLGSRVDAAGARERRLRIVDRLAAVIPDGRDATRAGSLICFPISCARIFAIACGYEDADDLDRLRSDPAFKPACGHLPDTGADLCSQPTVSRWENAPSLRPLIPLIDLYSASYSRPPDAVTLDIDDRQDAFPRSPPPSSQPSDCGS
jgi:hypothetical protein